MIISLCCSKKGVTQNDYASSTLQSLAPFKIGAAISPYLLQNNPAYKQTLSEFNSITTENALKWGATQPSSKDNFDFSGADVIVSFCEASHKRIHGHNLVWYQYNPQWVNQFQGDSAAWDAIFKNHIQTLVSRYKGKISSWDVVNEAFNEDGSLRVSNCVWALHLGKDYIAKAFTYAREADPSVLLFYNDYGQENSPAKTAAILAMVKDFKQRGIPIDGLGIQMHININTPRDGITNVVRQFAATGLKIHISELDISVNPQKDKNLLYNQALQDRQSDLFYFVVHQYRTLVPSSQQWGITTWNVGDADSWIRHFNIKNDWPLLFDDNYKRKPVYAGFIKGFSE